MAKPRVPSRICVRSRSRLLNVLPLVMALIKPFAAVRPDPGQAPKICELPYDVVSSAEARQIADGNPLSFFHVSKPEIDLPEGEKFSAEKLYPRARKYFDGLIEKKALQQDGQPCFYLYRQTMGTHSQTGIVAVASCQEYLDGKIKKHELTRPDKEDDRVKHVDLVNAQTGPAFLLYRAQPTLDRVVKTRTTEKPAIDFVAADGIGHTAWVIKDLATIEFIEKQFAQIPALYIADGHHRSAAAGRIFQQRQGAGASAFFLSVIFPHDALQILPYNRVLKDLNGLTPEGLIKKLDAVFIMRPGGVGKPQKRNELGFYFAGKWHELQFRPSYASVTDPMEKLDVTLLQKAVLGPIFGIEDPRTSQRIDFVGGIRGPAELEKLVQSGQYACAFSVFPTAIEDLLAVADAGGIMPPKSTWFEPKLRDGMFSHLLS